MKLNLRIASLLVIGIFGFSSAVLAQTNKKTSGKAQAKTGATSATPKKAKNQTTGATVTPTNTNTRPPSTGTGNGSNRPASTGETLSERDRIERAVKILMFAGTFPNGTVEDSGSNLARTRGFINQAYSNNWTLKNKYIDANNQNVNYDSNYSAPYPSDMNDVKNNLQQALNYLNAVNFETEQTNRAKAIDFTTQAIRQIDAYLIDPPAMKRTKPTKKAPNGAKSAKGKANGSQKIINQDDVDATLKTNPAGSTEKTTPSKTTTKKPKASSKTTKPTENLGDSEDPFGKTPQKPKNKVGNQ